jgi:gamma-glutamylputrescine oxidase
MKDNPYWLDIPYTPRQKLSKDIETGVVIIGGGITGISIAYHCAKQGIKTVLIEKDTLAFGSAGRNAGMVVDGLAIDFIEAVEKFGVEEATELWSQTVKARNHIIDLINEHSIKCDFTQPGSLYYGLKESSAEKLELEARARKQAGFACEIIEKGRQLKQSTFGAALFNPGDCTLHPVLFIRGLAEAAEKLGATIYENTEAITFDAHQVTTSQGVIKANKVVLAMESLNPHISKEESTVIRSQAIVTEPFSDEKMKELDWDFGGMFWTVDGDYISCRKIGNRLFTCKALSLNPTREEMEENKQWQINKMLTFFPMLLKDDIKISHQWSGLMVDTHNYRSYIRIKAGCYEVGGHGGNGLTNGIICGQVFAESLINKEIPAIYKN